MPQPLLKFLLLVVAANTFTASANCNRPECKYVDPYPLNECPRANVLIITINTGDYPEEIDWDLKKEDGAYVASLTFRDAAGTSTSGYDQYEPFAIYQEYVCLKGLPFEQTYTLKIFGEDDYFDGFRCHSSISGKEDPPFTGDYSGGITAACGSYTVALADGTILASGDSDTLRDLSSEGDGVAPVQFTTGSGDGVVAADDMTYDCSKQAMRLAGICVPTDGNCDADGGFGNGSGSGSGSGAYEIDRSCPGFDATETDDRRALINDRRALGPRAHKNKYEKRSKPQCFHAQTKVYAGVSSDLCVDDEDSCKDGGAKYTIEGREGENKCKDLKKKLNTFLKIDVSKKRRRGKKKREIKKECRTKFAGSRMRVWDHCALTCSTIGVGKCSDYL